MKQRSRACVGAIGGIGFRLGLGWSVSTVRAQVPSEGQKETGMSARASGTFEVKLSPHSQSEKPEDVGRMTIDKQFQGDLEASSKGEMLTAGTAVRDSAGYVAIERVTGTLQGRSGSFVLQHSGTMTRGTPQLSVTVVPDSGTGQLAGLVGKMAIKIADGKHLYEFEYTLPAASR